ncbi:hypothetical protein PoB_000625100 [Plakobranchus ocellatus]|uniref:Uncharacterized protein n=1 Tax=Plakobranchus ocellatus TaxID=259542 RepID=A0AAV3XXQ7_9GAST|nr:hypothetical protein PoB_000625100 [Plakobranchus ocellatus]
MAPGTLSVIFASRYAWDYVWFSRKAARARRNVLVSATAPCIRNGLVAALRKAFALVVAAHIIQICQDLKGLSLHPRTERLHHRWHQESTARSLHHTGPTGTGLPSFRHSPGCQALSALYTQPDLPGRHPQTVHVQTNLVCLLGVGQLDLSVQVRLDRNNERFGTPAFLWVTNSESASVSILCQDVSLHQYQLYYIMI